MNLNQLQYAYEISRLGSFSKAAQELYVSQSALSKSIHSLEEELGQEIFIRTPEGVKVTEYGKTFLAESVQVLEHISKIKKVPITEKHVEVLKFSAISNQIYFAQEVFMRILARHSSDKTEFEFYQKTDSEVFEAVRDDVCNLGILSVLTTSSEDTRSLLDKNDMEYHVMGRLKAGVALGRNNPVYDIGVKRLKKELLDGQLLVATRETIWPFSKEVDEIRTAFGTPKTVYVNDNDTAISICKQMPAYICVAQSGSIYTDLNMPLSMLVYPYQNLNLRFEYAWIKKRHKKLTSVEKLFVRELSALFRK